MKLDGLLLDNDELNGVDNEADDWQVKFFRQNLAFLAFMPTFLALSCNFWELVKLYGFLLDKDVLNGVENEADDWQVIFFSNFRQNLAFLAFCLLFWHFPVIFRNLLY